MKKKSIIQKTAGKINSKPQGRLLSLKDLLLELSRAGNAKKAAGSQGYFKTGKGEYGEGDVFLGITVPAQRAIASKYSHLSLKDLEALVKSGVHEHRFTCTEILNLKYARSKGNLKKSVPANRAEQEEIVKWYLAHTKWINNWDLVDNTAPYILGDFLFEKGNPALLYRLAKSPSIWERRIAIISTFAFIRKAETAADFEDTMKICELLLSDSHDLIHKACGWMLREMGKKELSGKTAEARAAGNAALAGFLEAHAPRMPRTMLRYAIERLPKALQKYFLTKR